MFDLVDFCSKNLQVFMMYFCCLIFPKQLLKIEFIITINNSKLLFICAINFVINTPIMKHPY